MGPVPKLAFTNCEAERVCTAGDPLYIDLMISNLKIFEKLKIFDDLWTHIANWLRRTEYPKF